MDGLQKSSGQAGLPPGERVLAGAGKGDKGRRQTLAQVWPAVNNHGNEAVNIPAYSLTFPVP